MRMLLFSMIFPITDGFELFSPWPKISFLGLGSPGFALGSSPLGVSSGSCCFPFPGWLVKAGSPFFPLLDGSMLGGGILGSFMVIPLVVLLEPGLVGCTLSSSFLVEAGLSVFSGLLSMVELEAGMLGSSFLSLSSSMLLLGASAVVFATPSSFFGSFGMRTLSVSPSNSILTRLMSPSSANIAVFDDHWKNREQAAKDNAAKAYTTDPHGVCNNVNKQANMNWRRTGNNTRRGLGKASVASCLAANPIDRCWRCDKNWAKNRQKLADCVLGFGHKTIGGKKGPIYEVVDDSDHDLLNPKPGTLRHAVIQDGPLWITFKHGMVIKLSEELLVSSNKTIDGRGGQVHIAGGAGIMLQYVDNVIIHSVHIHDIKNGHGGLIRDSVNHYGLRTASDGDGISIFGSTNIWIDHVSMSNCMDGLIDAIEASTAITISNCHFTDHNDVMLFGARDGSSQDEIMQVTLAYNHFGKRLIQRMPRCRYGFFHVLNNDYTHWEMYAIGGSQHPTIISQGNRFIAPPNIFAKEVTKREYAPYSVWKDWLWTSDDDIMQNGAFFNQSGDHKKKFSYTRQDMIKAKPGSYVKRLTRFAGALNCKEDKEC